MLHHPQYASRTHERRSPCPEISRTAGSRHRLFLRHPRFLLPNSGSAVCGGKEGGRQPGCPPEVRLGRAELPFGRRRLAHASVTVRPSPSFLLRMLNVWWLAMTISIACPHRYPQLKFGAMLPSVRGHLRLPSTEPVFKRLCDTLIHQCPNLRQLSISTQGPAEPVNSIDTRLLFSGDHWPNLRFLELGNVKVDPVLDDGDAPPFISFLSARNHLQAPHLSGDFTLSPSGLATGLALFWSTILIAER